MKGLIQTIYEFHPRTHLIRWLRSTMIYDENEQQTSICTKRSTSKVRMQVGVDVFFECVALYAEPLSLISQVAPTVIPTVMGLVTLVPLLISSTTISTKIQDYGEDLGRMYGNPILRQLNAEAYGSSARVVFYTATDTLVMAAGGNIPTQVEGVVDKALDYGYDSLSEYINPNWFGGYPKSFFSDLIPKEGLNQSTFKLRIDELNLSTNPSKVAVLTPPKFTDCLAVRFIEGHRLQTCVDLEPSSIKLKLFALKQPNYYNYCLTSTNNFMRDSISTRVSALSYIYNNDGCTSVHNYSQLKRVDLSRGMTTNKYCNHSSSSVLLETINDRYELAGEKVKSHTNKINKVADFLHEATIKPLINLYQNVLTIQNIISIAYRYVINPIVNVFSFSITTSRNLFDYTISSLGPAKNPQFKRLSSLSKIEIKRLGLTKSQQEYVTFNTKNKAFLPLPRGLVNGEGVVYTMQ